MQKRLFAHRLLYTAERLQNISGILIEHLTSLYLRDKDNEVGSSWNYLQYTTLFFSFHNI